MFYRDFCLRGNLIFTYVIGSNGLFRGNTSKICNEKQTIPLILHVKTVFKNTSVEKSQIQGEPVLPSLCTASPQAFSVNSLRWRIRGDRFARTTWPETHWPRGIMRPGTRQGPVHKHPISLKTEIFFSVLAFRPFFRKAQVFKNGPQSGDFWKRLPFVNVWTDENRGFRIRWCHTSYRITQAIVFRIVFPSF